MGSICAGRLAPVSDPRALAAGYGLAVEIADLGAWEPLRLIAEYDPAARAIRINARALAAYRRARGTLSAHAARTFIDRAVAHELFHHREACGEAVRGRVRAEREAAAERYAQTLVTIDAPLAAFLRDGTALASGYGEEPVAGPCIS